jgi:hypothetical protein
MEEAAAEYGGLGRSGQAWMLGRFVVPAARLDELSRAASTHLPRAGAGEPWRLSALLAKDLAADAARIASFNAGHTGRAVVDTVELKAAGASEIDAALDTLPRGLTAYVEVPPGADLSRLLPALRAGGARAKLRTGGVVPEAVPSPSEVACFIAACAAAGVSFKATAGLHHPVRAEQALTYAPGGPRAVTHGFVNVFAAAAFARTGASVIELEAVLREEDPSSFVFDGSGLAWRQLRVSTADLDETRRRLATSFGSCSFAEPVAGLRSMGILR